MKRSLISILLIVATFTQTHKIAIIGTGYVGLVSGPGLAEFGNTVICADIDKEKIKRLQQGEIPIYEPGLEELIQRNVGQGKLSFTDNVGQAIEESDIIFIAVGTPMGADGNADLRYIKAVLHTIAQHINKPKLIVIKSTVPVGSSDWAKHLLKNLGVDEHLFELVSNPEFLREGSSVEDFLRPDRIVIGAESQHAHNIMNEIYHKAFESGAQRLNTNIATSELIKYASNAFLAVKLSFINEIANFCDATGAQAQKVAQAMGMDHRISKYFLNPGPGYGGSCFPKDCQALIYQARQKGLDVPVVQASLTTNQMQKVKAVQKVKKLLNVTTLEAKVIAILGLAFKANTDDIRYSPAIDVIHILLNERAKIRAYDPEATENMQREIPDIIYCDSAQEAVKDADAVIIMTEWPEFKKLDLEKTKSHMKQPVIVDMRNLLDIAAMKQTGYTFDTMGNGMHRP